MIEILPYLALPSIVLLLTSLFAGWLKPGPKVSSSLQHLAAGIIFASIATELVPEILESSHVLYMVFGYAGGMLLIFFIRSLDTTKRNQSGSWIVLAIAGGVDLFIDGFLTGAAFSIAESSGVLLTIAIGFEVLFLGFTFSVSFANKGLSKRGVFLLLCAMSFLLLIGGTFGFWVLGELEPHWKVFALAFGCVALLYLVAEELLVEAHQTEESAIGPFLLFLGFGGMLVTSMLI